MNSKVLALVTVLVFLLPVIGICSDSVTDADTHEFPPSLASYDDAHLESIPQILLHRIRTEPLNLIVSDMRLIPLNRQKVIKLLLILIAPFLPLILTQFSIKEVLTRLAKTII